MKVYNQKLEIFSKQLYIVRKRINDIEIIELQKTINKMKELIDDEFDRRAENLNMQGSIKQR